MIQTNNKARKYGNMKGIVYDKETLYNISNILLTLSLMGLMFGLGLCTSGECAYIEERNPFTQEIISQTPQNYALALLTQNITTWLVVCYVGLAIWQYILKKKRSKRVIIK